jgi:hypothetical protein
MSQFTGTTVGGASMLKFPMTTFRSMMKECHINYLTAVSSFILAGRRSEEAKQTF